MPILNSVLYKATKLYLADASKDHARTYPQLACFAFDTITVSIHLDGIYERNELEALEAYIWPKLGSDGVAIDIGANIGNHSLFFAKKFAHVYALEPHPRTFKILSCNADLAKNITPIPVGASDIEQNVFVEQDLMNLGATSVRTSQKTGTENSASIPFHLNRLDAIDEIPKDSVIDFMKLDIEGHEEAALRGAKEILQNSQPVIAMEVLPEDIKDGSTASIDFLKELGYDHFVATRPVSKIARYPRRIFKLLKFLFSLIGLPPSEKKEFVSVSFPISLNTRYSMLICSTRPIL